MYTNDESIQELIKYADSGKIQLPDFQRGWVWDDERIKALISSITQNFPVGAAMFLKYGNKNIRFKYHGIEGTVLEEDTIPEALILDGQQRLTSIYQALFCKKPVLTKTVKGQSIKRFYYIDIEKAINPSEDMLEAIISVPENKMRTENFGKDIKLDVSTEEKEFEKKLFPLNKILDFVETQTWQNKYYAYYDYNGEVIRKFTEFSSLVINQVMQYKIPVIYLEKETPKEAVCQVFENVNTGGVPLTVFELVTAIFAMDDFELRKDWDSRYKKYFSSEIIKVVNATDFLTALTLLSTYKNGKTVSAKKKDVLNLSLDDYKKYADCLTKGFNETEKILQEERIFSAEDLPYSSQLIPMAVLCTLLEETHEITNTTVKNKIKQWYWCGVFGELYGGANTTRFVNDVNEVMQWISDDTVIPKTVADSFFSPIRLLSLQTRQSAAYKGIMALILQSHARDFISGREMDFAVYKSENPDIHHIFPKSYCERMEYPREKWNSIVNKTPITYRTNREIGGVAPSVYLNKIEQKGQITQKELNVNISTHMIDVVSMRKDEFDLFFYKRAIAILYAIEQVTGKTVPGRNSDEVVQKFGDEL